MDIFKLVDGISNGEINKKMARITFSDANQIKFAIKCCNNNLPDLNGDMFALLRHKAILISFEDTQPQVISRNKSKKMQMVTQLVINDTYYPSKNIIKFEILHDISEIQNIVDALRKQVESTLVDEKEDGVEDKKEKSIILG